MTHQPRIRLEYKPILDTPRRPEAGQLPRTVRVCTALTGVWLLLAPWVWGYGDTGGGFDAQSNDMAVGLVVLAAGCVQLARPSRLAVVVPIGFGFWLAIAPFALAYNLGSDPGPATFNDTVVGTLLTGFTVFGYLSTRDAARWDGHAAGPSESSPR